MVLFRDLAPPIDEFDCAPPPTPQNDVAVAVWSRMF
jgi:hypothetical protein